MDRAALRSPSTLTAHAGDTDFHHVLRTAEPFHHQVAGHQNVLADASGSLLIKPALAREIAFYQLVQTSSHGPPSSRSPLALLEPFLAKFYGTLRLEGCLPVPTDDFSAMKPVSEALKTQESVVLENLVRHYTRPNILDVKLGTVMYEPDASPEKKRRMEAKVAGTTSQWAGLRFTGCQTWHAPSRSYILTPKGYGKNIPVSRLPEGMTRFFPLLEDRIENLIPPSGVSEPAGPSDSTAVGAPEAARPASATSEQTASVGSIATTTASEADEVVPLAEPHATASTSGARSLTASGPRPAEASAALGLSLTSSSAPNATQSPMAAASAQAQAPYIPLFHPHSTPAPLLAATLRAILAHIDALLVALEQIEARFVGASVLIIYEGDAGRLGEGLRRDEERRARRRERAERRAADGRNGDSGVGHDLVGHASRGAEVDAGAGADGSSFFGSDEEETDGTETDSDYSDEDGGEDEEGAGTGQGGTAPGVTDYASSAVSGQAPPTGTDGSGSGRRRPCPALTVKMIDFAHTRLMEGEGPDEGVLLGLRSLSGLLAVRLGEVEAESGRDGGA